MKDFLIGEYYYLYNRGNCKKDIFIDDSDYIGYLEKLRRYKEKYNLSVICYCLTPNRVDLLIQQKANESVSKLLQVLHTSYSMQYNVKYDKKGHLFEGRFRRKKIIDLEHLLEISSCIHLNPLIFGLTDQLKKYVWSSYPDYINLRKGTLCDKKAILLNLTPQKYQQITEQEIRQKLIQKAFENKLIINK